jgi:hypothetical protein
MQFGFGERKTSLVAITISFPRCLNSPWVLLKEFLDGFQVAM